MTDLVERLARTMRDELYPDFHLAPPPEWSLRAATKIIAALDAQPVGLDAALRQLDTEWVNGNVSTLAYERIRRHTDPDFAALTSEPQP